MLNEELDGTDFTAVSGHCDDLFFAFVLSNSKVWLDQLLVLFQRFLKEGVNKA